MREPETHDCSRRDYFFRPKEGGQKGSMGVFGNGISPYPHDGDFVILRNGLGGTTRYRITEVRIPATQPDPPGQWFADLEFAPRDGRRLVRL